MFTYLLTWTGANLAGSVLIQPLSSVAVRSGVQELKCLALLALCVPEICKLLGANVRCPRSP